MNRKCTTIILICVVVTSLFIFMAIEVHAQDQTTSDIAVRLEEAGVPIKNSVITSRLPYKINLTLQSSSESRKLTLEDAWFILLAQHEATFAYRWGPRLNSFVLEVVNLQGEVIYSVETFLYREDLNQVLLKSETSALDDATAEEIVLNNLNLAGFSLTNLEVNRVHSDESSGHILRLTLTATSLEDANQSLSAFLNSFFKMLDTINVDYDTAIVLCRLQILDGQQTVLMDYVKDLESGYAQWYADPGLSSDWLPEPPLGAQAAPLSTLPGAYPADLKDQGESIPGESSYP
jgi:hypothetical protein